MPRQVKGNVVRSQAYPDLVLAVEQILPATG
jgi:hypothetical protein